ncbi:MAG: DJ-1/PfpI family protein [Pseudomonadota bacterium]|nr:DJ-1/PfpI family protein [Pseudomonadota bacterium]
MMNPFTTAIAASKSTGIEVIEAEGLIKWQGDLGGNVKPDGPLRGKRIGVIIASEFSDFQVYYLASYIGEMGGICDFLLVDWVTWKNTRPNVPGKGVRGMWDLGVDPIPVMGGNKNQHWTCLKDAKVADYDVLIIPGGHSADVMVTEPDVINFVEQAHATDVILATIGAGSMPLIRAGAMHGKRCTGDRAVKFMLQKIARFEEVPVVVDGDLLTARSTADTPALLRALCALVDTDYEDVWKNALKGKRVLIPATDDFEDIELVVPVMELLYRGAEVIIGHFEAELRARPGLLGSETITGNFGVTIPFQEIPDSFYTYKPLNDVRMPDFDVLVITGAFNPWNMVMTGQADWLQEANTAGKILSAICHGPIPLAEAGLVSGRHLTGWEASRDSVEIMGGSFDCNEAAALVDGRIVTGRTPAEIPEFIDAISVALLRE